MKATLLLFLALAAFAASEVFEVEAEKEYPRFIEFPDGEDVLHQVDLDEEPDYDLLEEVETSPANNLYLLFTRRNPKEAQTLVFNDTQSVVSSNFNRRYPTVVVVHGWRGSQRSSVNPTTRDAYLGKGYYNVIILDWGKLSSANYVTSARGVPSIGKGLGLFLRFLNRVTGAPYNSMHLVGFSLGAHLVGNAGRELGGKVGRITGLDPAGPLWNLNRNRLSASDGVYVEGIHTDGGLDGLGYGLPLGDADFFPNGGQSQPGCFTSVCYHSRAWKLFAATVSYNHLPARQCSNFVQVQINMCRGETLDMGNANIKKSGTGVYRVNTRRRYPYGPR